MFINQSINQKGIRVTKVTNVMRRWSTVGGALEMFSLPLPLLQDHYYSANK